MVALGIPFSVFLASLGLLLCVSPPVDATYFYITEGISRCFLQDSTEQAVLLVSYTYHTPATRPCKIIFKNRLRKYTEAHDAVTSGQTEKISFLALYDGSYEVCIECPLQRWADSPAILKWSLSVDTLGEPSKKEIDENTLSEVEKTVRRAGYRVNSWFADLHNELSQQKKVIKASESSTIRIFWVGVFQLITVFAASILLILYLVRFFKSEKLL